MAVIGGELKRVAWFERDCGELVVPLRPGMVCNWRRSVDIEKVKAIVSGLEHEYEDLYDASDYLLGCRDHLLNAEHELIFDERCFVCCLRVALEMPLE